MYNVNSLWYVYVGRGWDKNYGLEEWHVGPRQERVVNACHGSGGEVTLWKQPQLIDKWGEFEDWKEWVKGQRASFYSNPWKEAQSRNLTDSERENLLIERNFDQESPKSRNVSKIWRHWATQGGDNITQKNRTPIDFRTESGVIRMPVVAKSIE